MSRVFVLEPTEYSLNKAKKFGTLVFMFGDESEHAHVMSQEFLSQVEQKLYSLDFNPADDYLVIAGRTIAVAILAAVTCSEFLECTLLCYDNELKEYRTIEVSRHGSSRS